MADRKKIIEALAKKAGLKYIEKENIAYGMYYNYGVIIYIEKALSMQDAAVTFFVKSDKPASYLKTMVDFQFKSCRIKTGNFLFSVIVPIKGKMPDYISRITEIMKKCTDEFMLFGYKSCDSAGLEGDTSLYRKGDDNYLLLTDVSAKMTAERLRREKIASDNENVGVGLLGAVVGGAASTVILFFVSMLGVVSDLVVLLMGAGIVYGYKFKGKKLSIGSGIACILVSAILSYGAFRLKFSINISSTLNISIFEAFRHTKMIAKFAGSIDKYFESLILISGLAVIATIYFVCVELRSQKTMYELVKLN